MGTSIYVVTREHVRDCTHNNNGTMNLAFGTQDWKSLLMETSNPFELISRAKYALKSNRETYEFLWDRQFAPGTDANVWGGVDDCLDVLTALEQGLANGGELRFYD